MTRKSSQPSSTRMVNMNRGMPDRSSEVRWRHALAGTEGHSHLVIWVNYKCCRPQGGKMSWTAVFPHTYKHTHTHSGAQPICMVHSAKHHIPGARHGRKALRRSQVELGKSSPSQQLNSFSLSPFLCFSPKNLPRQYVMKYCVFFGSIDRIALVFS